MNNRRKSLNIILIVILLFIIIPISIFYFCNLRLNLTPSLPRGIYKKVDKEIELGDLVLFCINNEDFDVIYKKRNYLPFGLCDGVVPLLKPVIAQEGSKYYITEDGLFLDNKLISNTKPFVVDGNGLKMKFAESGILKKDQFLVISDYPYSFDSRYLGSINKVDIIGIYIPIMTY